MGTRPPPSPHRTSLPSLPELLKLLLLVGFQSLSLHSTFFRPVVQPIRLTPSCVPSAAQHPELRQELDRKRMESLPFPPMQGDGHDVEKRTSCSKNLPQNEVYPISLSTQRKYLSSMRKFPDTPPSSQQGASRTINPHRKPMNLPRDSSIMTGHLWRSQRPCGRCERSRAVCDEHLREFRRPAMPGCEAG